MAYKQHMQDRNHPQHNGKTCDLAGCNHDLYAKKLCFAHYRSVQRKVKLGKLTWRGFWKGADKKKGARA